MIIFIMFVSNPSLNNDNQMIIQFNILENFKIMGYGKLSKCFTSPNFNTA